jgi:hypothetical protein
MNYSPIVVPVLALLVWLLLVSLMSIPAIHREYHEGYETLSDEQLRIVSERDPLFVQYHPVPFYAVCLALAHMGAGRGMAIWLAWAFAMSWAAQKLPTHLSNIQLFWGASVVSGVSIHALVILAGIRVTLDLLGAYG